MLPFHNDCVEKLTSLNVNILAPDSSWGVLRCAIVGVVVDEFAEAGRGDVEDLKGAIGVHMADPWHIVDLLAGGQVPAQRDRGHTCGGTGHRCPCGAGKHYLLHRCIDKI